MNKGKPDEIVSSFVSSTETALKEWRSIDDAIATYPITLRRHAASNAFLSLAVSWEVFLTDWIVAAVNKNAARMADTLTKKLKTHAFDKLRIPETHIASKLITQSDFNLRDVRQILDPKEYNLTIRTHKELIEKADEVLESPYQEALLNITEYKFRVILATRLIRNVLTHQSVSSLREANAELGKEHMPAAFKKTTKRKLSINGWRTYLYAQSNKSPRVALFHEQLSDRAKLLTVKR